MNLATQRPRARHCRNRSSKPINGYSELAITGEHALAVDSLPPIDKDPLDRILVAQSMLESITLPTADSLLARYRGPVRVVGT